MPNDDDYPTDIDILSFVGRSWDGPWLAARAEAFREAHIGAISEFWGWRAPPPQPEEGSALAERDWFRYLTQAAWAAWEDGDLEWVDGKLEVRDGDD